MITLAATLLIGVCVGSLVTAVFLVRYARIVIHHIVNLGVEEPRPGEASRVQALLVQRTAPRDVL